MKNTINICIITVFIFMTYLSAFSQKAFYSGPVAIVNVNDTVVIRLNDYEGTIQWQKSLNLDIWEFIPGATQDTLFFLADTTSYFRAEVIAGDCDPFFSDTTMVGVFHITTMQVTEITNNSAQSGGNVISDGGTPVIARGVVWSTSTNPTTENNDGFTADDNGLGEFTTTITGLTPETTYFVRAYATNSAGEGYGQQESFTTQESGGGNVQPGNGVVDIDGNTYTSVIIGNQEWMAENLRVTQDADGNDIIRHCYSNDSINCERYGGLYTWFAVMNGAGSSNSNPSNVQGICPTGWHVPSNAEWQELLDYLIAMGFPNENIENGAGNALKSCRQVSSPLGGDCDTWEHPRWNSHSIDYGTDEFGFAALPGGFRNTAGAYTLLGYVGDFWSSLEVSSSAAVAFELAYNMGNLSGFGVNKGIGKSVRCIRDSDD